MINPEENIYAPSSQIKGLSTFLIRIYSAFSYLNHKNNILFNLNSDKNKSQMVKSSWGFLDGSVVKNPPVNAVTMPGSGRSWQPTPVFLPGKSHG